MALVKAFEHTSRCMQRLGFIKYAVSRCALSDTSNLASLGQALVTSAAQKVRITLTPEILAYVEKRLTDRAYQELRRTISKLPEESRFQSSVSLELQDIYLSSPELPSQTGKLVYDDWKRFPRFLSSLGLMRRGTYSLFVRGQLLLKLVPQGELAAFKEYIPEHNPFKLDLKQKLLFLRQFMEYDGDVLHPLFSQLRGLGDSFTDRDAGDLLPLIFRELGRKARPRARSGNDIEWLQQLLDTASSIEKWKGKPYSGKGAREESITVRVEPLVDIGLLDKEDPFSYRYRISAAGKVLVDSLLTSNDINDFLTKRFFQVCSSCFDITAEPAKDRHLILEGLYDSYNSLKSALGYAPITDVALLAGITSLIEKGIYFEVDDAVNILKQRQKEHPETLRFNIDRTGKLTYVKFNTAPVPASRGSL